MKPSTARVLALLRANGSAGLSDLEALEHAHTTRLAARIHELRFIEHYTITATLETARGARFARYVLHEEPEQMVVGL